MDDDGPAESELDVEAWSTGPVVEVTRGCGGAALVRIRFG
jgi:hypothetical protein